MSYQEEMQVLPGIEGDERLDSRLFVPEEKPILALNLFCFFTHLLLSFTPVVLLTFPYAAIAFFGKGSQRTKQAGLSALCGSFVAFALALLWVVLAYSILQSRIH